MEPKYKRVIIKFSGEALGEPMTDQNGKEVSVGLVQEKMDACVEKIGELLSLGCQVMIVIGGGNFWRGGRNSLTLERSRADQMGMLATVMNCTAFSERLFAHGIVNRVMSTFPVPRMAEDYTFLAADRALKSGEVVLFAGGVGSPYFSTDTGVALKAIELHADLILMAKNVDGIYTADPRIDPNATLLTDLTYEEVLNRGLKATDATAMALLRDNRIPMLLFDLGKSENLRRGVLGEVCGTLVH